LQCSIIIKLYCIYSCAHCQFCYRRLIRFFINLLCKKICLSAVALYSLLFSWFTYACFSHELWCVILFVLAVYTYKNAPTLWIHSITKSSSSCKVLSWTRTRLPICSIFITKDGNKVCVKARHLLKHVFWNAFVSTWNNKARNAEAFLKLDPN
jgi:hypothetical protein